MRENIEVKPKNIGKDSNKDLLNHSLSTTIKEGEMKLDRRSRDKGVKSLVFQWWHIRNK